MLLSRRRLLTTAGLASSLLALAGCDRWPARPAPLAVKIPGPAGPPGHWPALQRLTFGPTPVERARAATIGLAAWIEEQLAPEQLDDGALDWRLRRLDTLRMDPSIIFAVRHEAVQRELQQAALLRAVYSRRQLFEVIVDFWSDHFSVSTLKGEVAWLKPIDDRQVIRQHAFGRFGDLLMAVTRSPSMLIYLDNQENHRARPNENLARELLELHTLGVSGGYRQADVQAVARCLTGWTVDQQRYRGRTRFDAAQHDDDPKTILGQTLPAGGGAADLDRLGQLLLDQPATAAFVVGKLARRLIGPAPPPDLMARAVTTFRQTDGDLRATLRTILIEPALTAAPPRVKRPLTLVAGSLRQLQAETDGGPPLLAALAEMGQPLFQWLTPDGFPEAGDSWRDGLLARWQFALRLANDQLPGTSLDLTGLTTAAPDRLVASLGDRLLGGTLPADAQAQLVTALAATPAERRPAMAVALLLASPHFQLQ